MSRSGNWWWALGFGVLFAWFFAPLILLKTSFTGSDFEVQHWPWAHHLAAAIREGRLPLWTSLVQNGLPLAAEGQVGAFYLPHWIAYAFLPAEAAYTWLIPVHFLIGGIGMHWYVRRIGIGSVAAPIAALVFCFGSAYAGCFSNTASLRVCVWIPWALLCLRHLQIADGFGARLRPSAALAVLVALQWTAGAAQMALYSLFYYVFAFVFHAPDGSRRSKQDRRSLVAWFAAACGIGAGLLLSAPQTWLTYEFARASVRAGETASFALWGSIPPTGVLSLIFPEWGGMMRMSFYSGIVPLLLICAADWKYRVVRLHAIAAVVFFALALGRFNPLYAAVIESTGMTWMRNPGKWLLFVSLSMSVLAASGLDRWVRGEAGARRTIRFAAIALFAGTLALPGLVSFGMRTAEPLIERAGQRIVTATVIEKGDRAKSAEYYTQKFRSVVRDVRQAASYDRACVRFAILWSFLAMIAACLAAGSGSDPRWWAALLFCVAVADLGVYGHRWSTGFIGNAGPFPPALSREVWTRGVPGEGGWVELLTDPAQEKLTPNRGILHGIAHPGGYTPLIQKDYYDLVWELGIVDGSLGRAPVREKVWRERRGIADLIGARWIRADRELGWEGLTLLRRGDGEYHYRNERAQPAIAGYTGWKVLADPAERLAYMRSDDFVPALTAVLSAGLPSGDMGDGRIAGRTIEWGEGKLAAELEMPGDGVAMFRVQYDPAWRVRVNGAPAEAFRIDHAFLGVNVPGGRVLLEADYEPFASAIERIKGR